jgi:P4 family phage/plasmid primase-like protien
MTAVDNILEGIDEKRAAVMPAESPTGAAAELTRLPPAAFFTDRGRFVAPRLGELIQHAGHVRTAIDGRLWRYDRGVYRPDGDQWVRSMVREALAEQCARKHFEEVLAWLRSFEPTIGTDPRVDVLNVRNGLLDWRTGRLRPHDPDVVTTIQLPVAWNPEATCPTVDRFLADVLEADAVELVAELLGYALYPGNPFRKAVLFLGAGGNGKSKLLAVFNALVGPRNSAHVPLQALAENRFAAAELFGKLTNICGDLDARAVRRSDLFKQITGGDPVFAERKNLHPFTFTSYALPLFSANEAPISSDQTKAWFDRWLIIRMDNRFEGTDREDVHLERKLLTRPELEGALVVAVEGLRRLMERGHIAKPASVVAAGAAYKEKLDTAVGFVTESCLLRSDAWIRRPELYKAYRRWCTDSGRQAVSAESFNTKLRTDYPTEIAERTRRGQRGWSGIGLVDDGHDDVADSEGRPAPQQRLPYKDND